MEDLDKYLNFALDVTRSCSSIIQYLEFELVLEELLYWVFNRTSKGLQIPVLLEPQLWRKYNIKCPKQIL